MMSAQQVPRDDQSPDTLPSLLRILENLTAAVRRIAEQALPDNSRLDQRRCTSGPEIYAFTPDDQRR